MRVPPALCLAAALLCAQARGMDVGGPALRVRVGPSGTIGSLRIAGAERLATAGTEIGGCVRDGPAQIEALPDGKAAVSTHWRGPAGACTVRETLGATDDGIRWDIEVLGDGAPWSGAVTTRVDYPAAQAGARLWAPWSDPTLAVAATLPPEGGPWRDPLQARDFTDARLYYGAPPFRLEEPLLGFVPMRGDLIALPLASILEPAGDRGLSVILSPADALLDVLLDVTRSGGLAFRRLNHRISSRKPLHFTVDLVAHEADWRGGVRALCARHPQFMDPASPAADAMAGTGAYSQDEAPADVPLLKAMAFRINWKASFDFPYMGMFLPPVADSRQTWARFGGGSTSTGAMEAYAARMKDAGFFVLSYFNVTEFGAHVRWPPGTGPDPGAPWTDGQRFLFGRLGGAVLHVPAVADAYLPQYGGSAPGRPYNTWEGGIAMDCADPAYRAFLLQQARRHLDEIPSAAGLCIDRLDWLRLYNTESDDGVSWFNGAPARSVLVSWRSLMDELGPLVHQSGRVIFANNHDKRLDALRQVDGIYDEFGYDGRSLNLTALLCLRKPALAWTWDEKDLAPDPDAFFQRHLYLGVYPTAPVAGNDHTIGPVPWAQQLYRDYGPLFDAIRGKKWVLSTRAVRSRDAVRVNLFQVPGGYALPVAFGGRASSVVVEAAVPGALSADALVPGSLAPLPVKATDQGGFVRLEVPLVRGCAVVRLRTQGP